MWLPENEGSFGKLAYHRTHFTQIVNKVTITPLVL